MELNSSMPPGSPWPTLAHGLRTSPSMTPEPPILAKYHTPEQRPKASFSQSASSRSSPKPKSRMQVIVPVAGASSSGSETLLGTIFSTDPLKFDMESEQNHQEISDHAHGLQTYFKQAFHYCESDSSGNSCCKRHILYHGTDWKRAKVIESGGFQESQDGIFGPGVYLTGDPIKAALIAERRAQRHGGAAAVLELSVDVGKCKTYDATPCRGPHTDDCECKAWLKQDYDSLYASKVNQEETVIRNTRQIHVKQLIS